MRKKAILLATLAWCLTVSAFATPQIPDVLIYRGQEYPLTVDELMEPYFAKNPELNPKPEDFWMSALWRGYVAKFEIIDDQLLLKDITVGDSQNSAIKKVVPGDQPLKLDWVTRLLVSMYGNNDADPYDIESLYAYEKYSVFEIAEGELKEVRHFTNKSYLEFRKRQFDAFKKSSEYRPLVEKMTADGRLSESDADANIKYQILWRTKTFLVP